MNKLQFICSALLMMSIACLAHGSQAGKIETSAPKLLNPKSEIIVQQKVWKDSQLDLSLCTGSEEVTLPVLGECPHIAGYYDIGFPTCTQKFNVPKKFTAKEIVPGYNKLICELDYINATPIGEPDCDYSQCRYVEIPEPEFPLP